ncbi:dioxygenase [Saccharopolyspora sp. K220]|uniref:dioxygenase family protein n=1 Tax=Saccharopolyspora soli TaxID=2926618 RepID=UPI001F590EC3|nr:class III extradiol ring-cleavage dioxygenase [Saccharopolyspora soli]MCI2423504.1 dioxygenase [Saccharopolyspora soli]
MVDAPSSRMPTIYLSHGFPALADDPVWPGQLADWSRDLHHPKAILIVSAHWEHAPLTLGATVPAPLVHDFMGFPDRFYSVKYTAPGAPEIATAVHDLLRDSGTAVEDSPARGFDRGVYVPLAEMYPDADIPVLQLSMPSLQPERLMHLGTVLQPLREEGVLIVGSGFFTHNLAALVAKSTPSWSMEFDDWGRRALEAGDIDALLDFEHRAPASRLAHPRPDHFAPLFVTLGAAGPDLNQQHTTIDGFWRGLAKRSIQFGW